MLGALILTPREECTLPKQRYRCCVYCFPVLMLLIAALQLLPLQYCKQQCG